MTAERIAKAKKLKLIVTAGIGSDHTDLQAAIKHNVTVAEVTYCNSKAVAEHVVMSILALVRNFIPAHNIIFKGGWNIADACRALMISKRCRSARWPPGASACACCGS